MLLRFFIYVFLPVSTLVNAVPESGYSRIRQVNGHQYEDDYKIFIDESSVDNSARMSERPSKFLFDWNYIPPSNEPNPVTTLKPETEEKLKEVERFDKTLRNGGRVKWRKNRGRNKVQSWEKSDLNNKFLVEDTGLEFNISNANNEETSSTPRERKRKNKNRNKNRNKSGHKKTKQEKSGNKQNKKRKSNRKMKRGKKQKINNFFENELPELEGFPIDPKSQMNNDGFLFKSADDNELINKKYSEDDLLSQLQQNISLIKLQNLNETNLISDKGIETHQSSGSSNTDNEGGNSLQPIHSSISDREHVSVEEQTNTSLTEDQHSVNISNDSGIIELPSIKWDANLTVDPVFKFSNESNSTKLPSDPMSESLNLTGSYIQNEDKEFDALDEITGDISCLAGTFLPAPPSQFSAIRYVRTQTATTANLVAEYECEPSYHLENPKVYQVICSERKWMGKIPTCVSDFPVVESRVECHGGKGNCDHLCEVIGNNTVCTCYKGFRFENGICKDINECENNNGGCESICRNTPGSHHCACPSGLRLADDRKTCIDINECLLRNGHGPCQDLCHNKWGGYECSCKGITGTRLSADNHTCHDIDECADGTAGCSHTCLNTFGSAFCLCPSGFMLGDDWKTCQDIDECSYDELQSEQCEFGCVNTVGSYHCLGPQNDDALPAATTEILVSCPDGFYIDTEGNCKDIDECKDKTSGCEQGCLNTKGSYQCYCGLGFKLAPDNQTCIEGKETVCPPLESPAHGYWECARHLVRTKKSRFPWMKRTRVVNHAGAICQLRCPHGYILEGEYRKTCGQDSKWKGPEDGTCVRKLDYMFNVILKA